MPLFFFFRIEIKPYFEPREVTVKKGVAPKEIYDLLTEIGRLVMITRKME